MQSKVLFNTILLISFSHVELINMIYIKNEVKKVKKLTTTHD